MPDIDIANQGDGPYIVTGGALRPGPRPVTPLAELIHGHFRGMCTSRAFPCLGGQGAIRRDEYIFAVYPALGSAPAVRACASDLADYARDSVKRGEPFNVFVAAFAEGPYPTELAFEDGVIAHLAEMRELDPMPDATQQLREELAAEDRAFLYAGRNYFPVGFHPGASRLARRFAWPLLAFNDLDFRPSYIDSGKLDHLHELIMNRDLALQGTINESLLLKDQMAQVSGAANDEKWRCRLSEL